MLLLPELIRNYTNGSTALCSLAFPMLEPGGEQRERARRGSRLYSNHINTRQKCKLARIYEEKSILIWIKESWFHPGVEGYELGKEKRLAPSLCVTLKST